MALREVTELVTKDKTGGGVQMQRNPGRAEDWGTWWWQWLRWREGGAPVAILPTRRERKNSGEEGDAQKLAPCHKIMMKTFTMFYAF